MSVESISLSNAVTSLQTFLARSTADSPDAVREKAVAADYPYPELAAQVFKFLQSKKVEVQKATQEEVSEAFLALLLDKDAVEALGAGRTQNPWQAVRAALRNTGSALGASLLDVYNTVRQRGLGYTPTIMELAGEMASLFAAFAAAGKSGEPAMRAFCQGRGVESWQVTLACMYLRRRGKAAGVPTDHDLEEMFADKKLVAALDKEHPDGPWDVYRAQGEALRMLRHFGESLIALADGVA
jgi:hypothetical protein